MTSLDCVKDGEGFPPYASRLHSAGVLTPANVTKNTMYFLKETRPLLGHSGKKKICPPKKSKHFFRIAKIGKKWLSIRLG